MGDGQLIDNGWQLKGGRYSVDLGPVDVSRPGEYAYVLRGLPSVEFVIGIELADASSDRHHRPNHKAELRLEMKDTGGQTVVSETGSLEDWVWSYGSGDTKSFLYRRGSSREVRLSGSATGDEREINVKGVWGSYFTASEVRSYRLTLHVVDAATPQYQARLLLKSADE